MQRDQRDLLVHGVDARKHDAVGAVAVAEIAGLVTFLGAIGSHEQHVERLFGHVGFDQVLPHVAQASVQVAGKHLHVRERRADGYDRHGKRRDAGIEQLAVLFMLVGFGVLVARKAACRRLTLTSGRPVSAVAIARVAVLGAHICSGCAPAVGWLVRVCPARAVTVAPVACAFVIHTVIVTAPGPHASDLTRFAGNAHMRNDGLSEGTRKAWNAFRVPGLQGGKPGAPPQSARALWCPGIRQSQRGTLWYPEST